jgi:hypothetical protein
LNPVQELNGSNGVVANLLTGLRVDECFTRTDTATSTFLTDALGSTESVWSLPTMVRSRRSILTSLLARRPLGGAANGNSYQFTGRENDGIIMRLFGGRLGLSAVRIDELKGTGVI